MNDQGFSEWVTSHRLLPIIDSQDLDNATTQLKRKAHLNSLSQTAELLRINRSFQENDIPLLHFKGPTLSFRLFGDVGKRQSKDLDILIDRSQVWPAHEVMVSLGYRCRDFSKLCQRTLSVYTRVEKDLVYYHENSGHIVELHWQCINVGYKPFYNWDTLWENRQSCSIGDETLYTFSDLQCLYYLSYHGDLHRWSRLKWAVDFATLWKQLSESEKQVALAAANTEKQFRLSTTFLLMGVLFSDKNLWPLPPSRPWTVSALVLAIYKGLIRQSRYGQPSLLRRFLCSLCDWLRFPLSGPVSTLVNVGSRIVKWGLISRKR